MKTALERVTFTPGEFAALFGKSQTWGYRQIYAGKVKTITEYGRILIPASEVERILATAARYEGIKKKLARTKAELQSMKPKLQSAWEIFIRQKRSSNRNSRMKGGSIPLPRSAVSRPDARKAALTRLTRGKESGSRTSS
ncbi:MAG: hypothetical protein QOE70_224 [Chthoniobacter sp.]|jgi:hypothetical protein|nr:hypothetical protein [Chthoniobacter sp.]